ncbi:hypothetical protein GCM10023083_66910 [Streptomyces phyllanthi]
MLGEEGGEFGGVGAVGKGGGHQDDGWPAARLLESNFGAVSGDDECVGLGCMLSGC